MSRTGSLSNLLQPRLCHLLKWPDYEGFGFNLMTKKEETGHFIADVEILGPADLSGLRDGDRVIEVNGINVQTEPHLNVAKMIAVSGDEVKLLVVDELTYNHYQQNNYSLDSSILNVVYIRTPDKQPNDQTFEPTVVYNENFTEESYVLNSSREETTARTFARYSSLQEPSTVEYNEISRETVEMTQMRSSVKVEPEAMGSNESGFVSLAEQCNGKISAPRMCKITKWSNDEGYGFSLNTPKDRRGHFVSKIDDNSPASNSGIKHGDRIIEVNGSNIELMTHSAITEMIRKSPNSAVTLLVIDEESYGWYCEQGIEVTGNLPNIIYMRNPERVSKSINSVAMYLKNDASKRSSVVSQRNEVQEEPFKSATLPVLRSENKNGHVAAARTYSGNRISNNSADLNLPEDAPAPRLCHLLLVPHFSGFGFGLRTYKATGFKYIVDIKPRSPAAYAGLREWDRVIEVNGVNVNVDNHAQVCGRIQSKPNDVKILVLEEGEYEWYTTRNLVPKNSQKNVIYLCNLVDDNVAGDSHTSDGNPQNVYQLSTAEVRERISSLKRQDPRNKNVDFHKRIEMYEQM
ncbi:uncharacterized protein B4U80_09552 [Leptotrombidium deliense]|uniref:PDZ domain-containing protein n=1 Tax=Leptotrombidium deliense TaxID=299467 RepID=A0A443SVQ0_9ACAR|nr:uncharacterized protein B4U80_09552 [Leptotrombidium deliense]